MIENYLKELNEQGIVCEINENKWQFSLEDKSLFPFTIYADKEDDDFMLNFLIEDVKNNLEVMKKIYSKIGSRVNYIKKCFELVFREYDSNVDFKFSDFGKYKIILRNKEKIKELDFGITKKIVCRELMKKMNMYDYEHDSLKVNECSQYSKMSVLENKLEKMMNEVACEQLEKTIRSIDFNVKTLARGTSFEKSISKMMHLLGAFEKNGIRLMQENLSILNRVDNVKMKYSDITNIQLPSYLYKTSDKSIVNLSLRFDFINNNVSILMNDKVVDYVYFNDETKNGTVICDKSTLMNRLIKDITNKCSDDISDIKTYSPFNGKNYMLIRNVVKKNHAKDRKYQCSCGYHGHRDIVGAINITRIAL